MYACGEDTAKERKTASRVGYRAKHPGIRLRRRCPHPSPDEQARRPPGGVCEPDFLTLRVEKLGSKRGCYPRVKKMASRVGCHSEHPGIRQSRRYPPPSPDEQARRSPGGVCEPDFLTLRVEKPASNRGDTAKERKAASRMGYRFRVIMHYGCALQPTVSS